MLRMLVLVLMVSGLTPAQGVTVRVCADESTRNLMMTPDGRGAADRLIREAAAQVGLQVEYFPAPITRCREELRLGRLDAFPMVPNTSSLDGVVALPRSGGSIDTARAMVQLRALVYRRVGSTVDWDGKRFGALRTRVLVPAGSVMLLDRLKALDVAVDDSGKGLAANLSKLAAGRADVALGVEVIGRPLLATPPFAGRIEALPIPFMDEPYYFGVSLQFYESHPQLVERMWDAIVRIRQSAGYELQWRRMMEAPRRAQ